MFDKFRIILEKKLPPGSFARNVITLMTGTTFGQALSILVAPILTRIYSPADFGVLALYSAILGVLSVIACWRYETAIVLPSKDEDAANLLALCILICFGMALVSLFGTAAWATTIERWMSAPGLAAWLWFMPISVLTIGLFMAFSLWSTRRKHFKRLAIRAMTQSFFTSVTQVGVGIAAKPGPGGLIGGQIVGQIAATARLAWQIEQDEGSNLRSYINIKDIKKLAIDYRRYPFFSSWSGILNTFANVIPTFMIGYFFSAATVGLYSLGHRVLFSPMELLGAAIERVYLPQAVLRNRENKLKLFTQKIYKQLVELTLTPILLIAILAPAVFNVIFGADWVIAGIYTRWLCIWAIFRFVTSPITGLYDVFGKQKQELFINGILFGARFAALFIGGKTGDPVVTIALYALVGAFMYIVIGLYLFSLCNLGAKEFFAPLIRSALKSLPYLVPVLLATIYIHNEILIIIVGFVSGIVFLIEKQKILSMM